jgi:hypothetical protein
VSNEQRDKRVQQRKKKEEIDRKGKPGLFQEE